MILKSLCAVCALSVCAAQAEINILILGSDSAGDRFYEHTLTQGQSTGTPPFLFTEVASHLSAILAGAGHGAVKVTTQNIAFGIIDGTASNSFFSNRVFSSNLLTWFYWPYGEWKMTNQEGVHYEDVTGTEIRRWANLRGEEGVAWDYVILMEDPATIERYPGLYAVAVARIAEAVAQGSGETVLLMPWPAPGSSSTLQHYKEVVYRVGRSAGVPVAPAGLAWAAAGSPTGATHPSSEGAFIAAATLYSRLFEQSAATSSYTFNDALANTAHATVQANQGAPQFSGPFEAPHPTRMLADPNRRPFVSNRGTSTEQRFRRELIPGSFNRTHVGWNSTISTYSSDTPDDDGLGWPFGEEDLPIAFNWGRHHAFSSDGPEKSYFTNSDYWQLGFGFPYQLTSDSVLARALIGGREIYVAYLMSEGTVIPTIPQTDTTRRNDEIETARLLPIHLLFAEIQRRYPDQNFRPDGTHLNRAVDLAAATFMQTIYSGRTPIDDSPTPTLHVPDPEMSYFAQKLGHELAWIAGTLNARAPGFQVRPSSINRSAASETFRLRFFNQPKSDVVVHVGVSDPALAEVSQATLVFTPETYSIPAEITTRARLSADGSGPEYMIQFTTSSDDPAYNGLSDSWAFSLPTNAAPSLDWVSPAAEANPAPGSDLTVEVNSVDPDGTVAHVTLWLNDQLVRQINAPPYRWSPAEGDSILAHLDEDVYRLTVRTVDNLGEAYQMTRTILVGDPASSAPPAPGGLTATASFNLVTLSWEASSQGQFQSFSVYRSTVSGTFGTPLEKGLTENTFSDDKVENGNSYFYVVTATDVFGNESVFSAQVKAVPSLRGDAVFFGSTREGLAGFATDGALPPPAWTVQAEGIRYLNDGSVNTSFVNSSLLRQYSLDRSAGAEYAFAGTVDVTSMGPANRPSRVGLSLFANSGDVAGIDTGIMLMFVRDGNLRLTAFGVNNFASPGTSAIYGGSVVGGGVYFYEVIVRFNEDDAEVEGTLTDFNGFSQTLSTTVPKSLIEGEFFGFGARTRTDSPVNVSFEPQSFSVTNLGAQSFVDNNNNGIDDAWERENFGRLLGEDENTHESGVPYFFMYLHGTDPNDPSDRGFRMTADPGEGETGVIFAWEVLPQFQFGEDYQLSISTDLTQWDPLPGNHFFVEQIPLGNRTRMEVTLTHDYGDRVFLRLQQP